jgi:tetratricopeptide (TPR) repeat protein
VIDALENSIRLRPDDAETRNYLGLVYVQTGDDDKAIAAFRQAIKLRPDYADAHQNLGAVLTTSDATEAVRELEAALKLQPTLLKTQYNLALAYEANPQFGPARAIAQLGKVLAADARYPHAEYALGRMLLRQNKIDEAIDHLRRAVAQEPAFGEARYQLGLALSRSGRADEGTAEIRRSREIITANENEQAAGVDLAEAKAALDRGDTDTAIAKARKVLVYRAEAAEAKTVLDAALKRKGELGEALTGPEADIRTGRFAEAEASLRAFLAWDPKSARGWYDLGYACYAQRKIGESIKALAQSLDLDRSNDDAHKVLGRDLMIIGRFDAARLEFEQGARLNPKSAEMPYNLGKLFSIQDNWADARRKFEMALRLDPAYMEAHDGLGLALEALGDDAGAIVSYKRAIEINESRHAGFASPYVNMSALSNRAGDRRAAMDYARQAIRINPNSDRALFQMAKAQEYEGDLNSAADALHRAIAINPHSSSYFYVLSAVYRKLGKAEQSRKAMEEFSRLDRESNAIEERRRELLRDR